MKSMVMNLILAGPAFDDVVAQRRSFVVGEEAAPPHQPGDRVVISNRDTGQGVGARIRCVLRAEGDAAASLKDGHCVVEVEPLSPSEAAEFERFLMGEDDHGGEKAPPEVSDG